MRLGAWLYNLGPGCEWGVVVVGICYCTFSCEKKIEWSCVNARVWEAVVWVKAFVVWASIVRLKFNRQSITSIVLMLHMSSSSFPFDPWVSIAYDCHYLCDRFFWDRVVSEAAIWSLHWAPILCLCQTVVIRWITDQFISEFTFLFMSPGLFSKWLIRVSEEPAKGKCWDRE